MKKIAVFGATGQTGRKFVELALQKGYTVRALVRNRTRLPGTHPRLELIEGDVLSQEAVTKTLEGCSLVLSLFGHVKGSPPQLQTQGTQHILSAMQIHAVPRIISLSGGGLPFPEKDQPGFADYLIRGVMRLLVPRMLNDAIVHARVLKASPVKWVVVRAPRLTNAPGLGRYRVGWVGVNASMSISRSDLALFLLSQVEDETFNFQMPFVSGK